MERRVDIYEHVLLWLGALSLDIYSVVIPHASGYVRQSTLSGQQPILRNMLASLPPDSNQA
jgi:hypothetical protein